MPASKLHSSRRSEEHVITWLEYLQCIKWQQSTAARWLYVAIGRKSLHYTMQLHQMWYFNIACQFGHTLLSGKHKHYEAHRHHEFLGPVLQRWNWSRFSWPTRPVTCQFDRPVAGWPARLINFWPAGWRAKFTIFKSFAMPNGKDNSKEACIYVHSEPWKTWQFILTITLANLKLFL